MYNCNNKYAYSEFTVHPHRESFFRVDLDHAPQQSLAVRWDEMGHVEHSTLHLFQQLPQVIVVEGQCALWTADRKTHMHRDRW